MTSMKRMHHPSEGSVAVKPGRKFGLTGQRPAAAMSPYPVTTGNTTTDGRRMSIREERNSWMYSLYEMSEQEMEDKYNAICLSVRTENLTLGQRLEHQHAERDLVEMNLSEEVRTLHSYFVMLKQEVARSQLKTCDGGSGGFHELFAKLASQVDAVHNCALRISSTAESLGAVEYESRLSAAVQILILYVDNVKRKWEREHRELEETKRILKESGVNVVHCLASLPQPNRKSESVGGPVSKRRASFPAAPSRRISAIKTPPVASPPLQAAAAVAATTTCDTTIVAVIPPRIDEEREDGETSETQPATTVDKEQARAPAKTAPAEPVLSSTEKATITIRRRGRAGGGYKSHSWSSGSSGMPPEQQRKSQSVPVANISWITSTGQRTRQWWNSCLSTVKAYGSAFRHHIYSLPQSPKHLLMIRYSASAICLFAALLSLVLTFVPTVSPPKFNASASL